MKTKAYITPEITITQIAGRQIICAGSITDVGGNAGVTLADDEETPGTADSRRRYNDWDDEDEEEDW